jgi:hypothetical protein
VSSSRSTLDSPFSPVSHDVGSAPRESRTPIYVVKRLTKLKQAHNCDFMTAPIGYKICHYEAEVSTVRTAINAEDKPIISTDDGKSWTSDESVPRTKSSVWVSWKKVDEDED